MLCPFEHADSNITNIFIRTLKEYFNALPFVSRSFYSAMLMRRPAHQLTPTSQGEARSRLPIEHSTRHWQAREEGREEEKERFRLRRVVCFSFCVYYLLTWGLNDSRELSLCALCAPRYGHFVLWYRAHSWRWQRFAREFILDSHFSIADKILHWQKNDCISISARLVCVLSIWFG